MAQKDPAAALLASERNGVKVFHEDKHVKSYLFVTFASSWHRRYLGAPYQEGPLHQGSELSYSRQTHLVVSFRQLAGFALNSSSFFAPLLLLKDWSETSLLSCLKMAS